VFSEEQTYVVEFGHLEIGFATLGGTVQDPPGTRYTIVSPYGVDDLPALKIVQSADVMYIAHPDYPVHKLSRLAETNWTIEEVNFLGGPWLSLNLTDVSADPTGLNVPSITMGGSGSGATNVLNSSTTSYWSAGSSNEQLTFTYDAGVAVAGYTLTFRSRQSDGDSVTFQAPRKWAFQGSDDGNTWITLDQRQAETDWQHGELRSYYFQNDKAYTRYRLDIETGNGSQNYIRIAAVQLYQKGVAGTLTFTDTEGINDGAGFNNDDIGRQIRWMGKDGFWRILTITGVSSTTSVTGTWEGFWEWDEEPGRNWQLGAFSKNSGYPRTISLFQERLCLSATYAQPRTVFMSASADYEDFSLPDPVDDTSPITVTLAGSRQDKIEWTVEVEKLLMCGTTDSVVSIGGTENAIISVTNVQQRKHAGTGSAPNLSPVRAGPVLLYPDFHARSMHELIYTSQSDGYTAPEVSVMADHMYQPGVRNLTYSHQPNSTIYAALWDGDLISFTYERDQSVVGHALFEFPNGLIRDVVVIPEDGRDALYVLMERTINAVTRHYLERLEPMYDFAQGFPWFLDSALLYEGAQTTVITGLDHLEGETVRVFGWDEGGTITGLADPTEYVVSSGQITLVYSVTKAVVGIMYDAKVKLMPFALQLQDGASYGREARVDGLIGSFLNSRAVKAQSSLADAAVEDLIDTTLGQGSTVEIADWLQAQKLGGIHDETLLLRADQDAMDEYVPLFTGDVRLPIDDTWEGRAVLEVLSDEPQPCTLLSVTPMIDWEPGPARG
jgi:hypothetical protein